MNCVNLHNLSADEFDRKYTILEILDGSVYKATNTATNQVVVLKMGTVSQEIRTICEIRQFEDLRRFTSSLVRILEYGTKDSESIFYTMPLYHQIIASNLNYSQQLEAAFELLLAIIVLNQHGIRHNDLHFGNIVFEPVNYKREYIVNDTPYICTSGMIPVIIDFGKAIIGQPLADLSEEIQILVGEYSFDVGALEGLVPESSILEPLLAQLRQSRGFEIVLHPIFAPLTRNEIAPGDTIKIFADLNI